MASTIYDDYIQELEKMNVMVIILIIHPNKECHFQENPWHNSEWSAFNWHQNLEDNSCESGDEDIDRGTWVLWWLVWVETKDM